MYKNMQVMYNKRMESSSVIRREFISWFLFTGSINAVRRIFVNRCNVCGVFYQVPYAFLDFQYLVFNCKFLTVTVRVRI
jgi:hypothetical protein